MTNKEKVAEYQRKYRRIHKKKVAERSRKYYQMHKEERIKYRQTHKEAHAENSQKYYQRHKAAAAENRREYNQRNKGEIAEKKRKYYQRNKGEILEKKRKYHSSPEGHCTLNRANHKRRARAKNTEATLTAEQWETILKIQGNCCNVCGKRFTKKRPPTIDHIIPLSEGGGLTFENVQALCKSCNSRKHAKIDPQFIQSWGYIKAEA